MTMFSINFEQISISSLFHAYIWHSSATLIMFYLNSVLITGGGHGVTLAHCRGLINGKCHSSSCQNILNWYKYGGGSTTHIFSRSSSFTSTEIHNKYKREVHLFICSKDTGRGFTNMKTGLSPKVPLSSKISPKYPKVKSILRKSEFQKLNKE